MALGLGVQYAAADPRWAWPLFAAAVLLAGREPGRRGVASLRRRVLDIHVLMLVAVTGALVLGDWAEAATVIWLFAVSQWLEVRTMERARRAIRGVMTLAPTEARVKHGDHEHVSAVDLVLPGATIVVAPGQKVPLDGIVVAGTSDVNQAPITGESLPVPRGVGDEVFAGTINGQGALDVRVTRAVRDTTLARIVHLVEAAQAQRAPAQQFIDRFARWYTPAVVLAALAVFVVPVLFGGGAAEWSYRALVLLVVACPCALVISTPVSIVAALATAARHGVLIKGGAHLERLDLLVIDLRLPHCSGAELIATVRKLDDGRLPILAFSGTVSSADEVRELAALGVAGYVNEYSAVQHILPSLAPHLFPDNFNRRGSPRVVLGIPAAYHVGATIAAALSLNISRGGIAIRTTSPLEPMTKVRVRFRLPGSKKDFDIDAHVRWSDPRAGMGLQFDRVDPADQAAIDEFVDSHFFQPRKREEAAPTE